MKYVSKSTNIQEPITSYQDKSSLLTSQNFKLYKIRYREDIKEQSQLAYRLILFSQQNKGLQDAVHDTKNYIIDLS